MNKLVVIGTILLPLAMMAAQASSGVPARFDFRSETDALHANSGQVSSPLSPQAGESTIGAMAATPARQAGSDLDVPDPAAVPDFEVNRAREERSIQSSTNDPNVASLEEEEEEDEGDEEEGAEEEEENDETGWDRMWDAPKLG